jgi:hypothetical protein
MLSLYVKHNQIKEKNDMYVWTVEDYTAETAAAAFDTFVNDRAYDTLGITIERKRELPALIEYTILGDVDQGSGILDERGEQRGAIRFQTLPNNRVKVSIEILSTQTEGRRTSVVRDHQLHNLFRAFVDHVRSLAQWPEEYSPTFAKLLDEVRQAQTNDEKGESLEFLAELLFGRIRGLEIIDRDLRTSAEEIDLLISNESDEPFWLNLGNPFLVECRNWEKRVGAKEIRDLKGKMGSRGVKTAFLLAKNGVSGNNYKDAQLIIREALKDDKYIIVVEDSDLQNIASGTLPSEILRIKYRDTFRLA